MLTVHQTSGPAVSADTNGGEKISKYVGVRWSNKKGKWRVRIKANRKDNHVGFVRLPHSSQVLTAKTQACTGATRAKISRLAIRSVPFRFLLSLTRLTCFNSHAPCPLSLVFLAVWRRARSCCRIRQGRPPARFAPHPNFLFLRTHPAAASPRPEPESASSWLPQAARRFFPDCERDPDMRLNFADAECTIPAKPSLPPQASGIQAILEATVSVSSAGGSPVLPLPPRLTASRPGGCLSTAAPYRSSSEGSMSPGTGPKLAPLVVINDKATLRGASSSSCRTPSPLCTPSNPHRTNSTNGLSSTSSAISTPGPLRSPLSVPWSPMDGHRGGGSLVQQPAVNTPALPSSKPSPTTMTPSLRCTIMHFPPDKFPNISTLHPFICHERTLYSPPSLPTAL